MPIMWSICIPRSLGHIVDYIQFIGGMCIAILVNMNWFTSVAFECHIFCFHIYGTFIYTTVAGSVRYMNSVVGLFV